MILRHITRSSRTTRNSLILLLLCLSCTVIYMNLYGYIKIITPSSPAKPTPPRRDENDEFLLKRKMFYKNKTRLSGILNATDQFSLWKNIVVLPVGSKKSFSFARHGEPINLYSKGQPLKDAPRLVANLTVTNVSYVLTRRQTRSFSVNGVACRKLIIGETPEIMTHLTADRKTEAKGSNCKGYIANNGYLTSEVTALEKSFPLAFSILIYTDFQQFERLMRMIYRPQNIYCIHIDKKSNKEFREAVRHLANCFSNVFITKRSVDVKWGEFSVLEPELICIEELLRRHKTWKYFINLTGQEFPLRTNYELVKILDSVKGANLVEGTVKRDNKERWIKVGPPPHGLTPVKGSIHVVLNRNFVDYAIHSSVGKALLGWCRRVEVPDELFFSTLHNNPQLNISGSYKGIHETDNATNPYLARFKNWEDDWPCMGKNVRGICVFGVGDLPLLATREELFANKFHLDFEPATLDCLEDILWNRTREEYLGHLVFNTSYYSSRAFVMNKV